MAASKADRSTASIEAAVRKFPDTDVSALVVYNGEKRVRGQLFGIVDSPLPSGEVLTKAGQLHTTCGRFSGRTNANLRGGSRIVKRIKDLRTRGLGTVGIQQESSVEDAVREFLATDLGALVVYDGKKLVGIFTRNDLVRHLSKGALEHAFSAPL